MTIESEEFYNLMQTYRHTPVHLPSDVVTAYQAVIDHVNKQKMVVVWELLEALEDIAADCDDAYPPSYGAIRQAAKHAINKAKI